MSERITRPPGVPMREPPHLGRDLEMRHLEVLLRELGRGEPGAHANNGGEDVLRYRAGDGTGGEVDTDGPWCAAVQSYCWMVAAAELGVRLPFRTSRGARRLAERIGACSLGRYILAPGAAPPAWDVLAPQFVSGCTIATYRDGSGGQWSGGHVMTFDRIDDESIIVIEGNHNNRGPRGARYAVVGPRRIPWVELRPRLYAIATLQPG